MEPRSRTLLWPYVLVLVIGGGILLTALALPGSGWTAQRTVAQLALSRSSLSGSSTTAIASSSYESNLVETLSGPANSSEQIRRMRELLATFPDQPSLWAHLVRYRCMGAFRLGRQEFKTLDRRLAPTPYPQTRTASTTTATLLEETNAGIRLDPSNSYFHLFRSIALLELQRDKEAYAALEAAAYAPKWNDYCSQELDARIHMLEPRGPTPVIRKLTVAGSLLFPHYAQMRQYSRCIIGIAVQKELAGDRALGMRLRRALIKLASRITIEAPNSIGNVVAVSMAQIAISRPGGAELPDPSTPVNEESRSKRVESFLAYATTTHSQGEVDQFRRVLAEGARVRAFWKKERSTIFAGMKFETGLKRNLNLWLQISLLCVNAIWFLVLGLATVLFERLRVNKMLVGVALLIAMFGLVSISVKMADVVWPSVECARTLQAMTENPQKPEGLAERLLFEEDAANVKRALAVAAMGFPLVVSILLLVVALVGKRSGIQVVTASLASLTLVACLGLLVVSRSLGANELRADQEFTKSIAHEGRYIAQLEGKSWPP